MYIHLRLDLTTPRARNPRPDRETPSKRLPEPASDFSFCHSSIPRLQARPSRAINVTSRCCPPSTCIPAAKANSLYLNTKAAQLAKAGALDATVLGALRAVA